MRNNKRFTWDIYKVTEGFNEWLSRHFDKTYDEMMLILKEGKSREDFTFKFASTFINASW